MTFKTERFIVFTEDEKDILTYGGFKPFKNFKQASPKLFPNKGCAKEAVQLSYGEEAAQSIIIKKVEVTYNYDD